MIINTISDIKKIVLEIALFTLLLLALLYFLLLQGFEISSLHLGGIDIQKLYLKLDKKLILRIERITIPQKEGNNRLPQNVEYINIIGKFFQEIDIKDLSLEKEDIAIAYKNGLFEAKGQSFETVLKLYYNKLLQRLEIKIVRYYNKRYNLSLSGIMRIYKKSRIFSILSYNFEGIKGKAKFLLQNSHLTFFLNSETFDNKKLRRVFTHLHLHPLINRWSYQNIKARHYKLLYAKGEVDIDHFDPKQIEAKAIGEDVNVWFQRGIDPVHIAKIALLYKNDNLYFTLNKPQYHDKDLSGSKVTIYNLTKSGSYIDIFLKTYAPLDLDIKKIVASYGINLPLLQKEGGTDAQLLIQVRFKDGSVNLKGEFFTQKSLFDLDGLSLRADKAFVKLINSRVLIKESHLALEPFIEADVKGAIDLTKKSGKLLLRNGSIQVSYNNSSLLYIPDFNDTLHIDLEKKEIRLQKFLLRYAIDTKQLTIEHLEDLKPYSPLLEKFDITYGSLVFAIPPKKINARFHVPNSPFFSHSPITEFKISVDLQKKEAKLNNFASISFENGLKISLHDIGLDLAHFKNSDKPQKIFAKLKNVTLRYKKHQLLVKDGLYRSTKKGFIFQAHTQKGKIVVKKSQKIAIDASEITAQTLNQLIGKRIFFQGRYQIKATGTKRELRGRLSISNGYLKDLKLINNFFAFLNTIPALMTLSDPGFDKTGLLVKRGTIDFIYTHNKLILTSIKLRSISMDIVGSGIVDLNAKTIKMRLELQTLKNVANVIKNIPLAGYILLGKDGTISTAVEVYGSLKDPRFRSLLPSDTIKMPFNIIKRTLELPFKLFE